jgi:membrane protein
LLRKNKIHRIRQLLALPLVRKTIYFAKRTSFAGFSGIPLYNVVLFILKELKRDDLFTRANSVAYSFFLALFPALIVVITFLPYVPIDDLVNNIKAYLDGFLPADAEDFIFGTLDDLTTIPRGGTLSIGAVLALFFSSNGMLELMNGFDKSYHITFKQRGFIRKRILALSLTLLLGFMIVIAGVLIVLGNTIIGYIVDWLEWSEAEKVGILVIKWTAVVVLIYTIISFIYKYGPALRKRSSFFSPGTTLASILTIVVSVGFSFFVNNFNTYNKIYGSISAIIVLMVWFQLLSTILLIGFELNASIAVQRDLRKERESRPHW